MACEEVPSSFGDDEGEGDVDDESFATWTVGKLKEFLRKRGGRLSGRKSELVQRAIFYDAHKDAAKGKSRSKTTSSAAPTSTTSRASSCPYTFPDEGWSSDRSAVPPFTASVILSLLLRTGKSVSSSGDEVTIVQKPLRRGHDFFFNGYVHDVRCVMITDERGLAFVRSKSRLGVAEEVHDVCPELGPGEGRW